jgi:hypothetical protein
MSNRLAYSLVRFSTPQQALGDSKRRQLEATAAFCVANTLDLVESILDEGLSGYHGVHRKRGALGRFVKRFQDGEIPPGGVFIAEAFDRLSREPPRIAQQLFLTLINGGMDVHLTISGNTFTQKSIDANVGELFMAIGMMIGAHQESHNKAGREREAWKTRHVDPAMNIVPYWFDKFCNGLPVSGFKGLPKNSAFEVKPNAEKVAIIQRIFRDILTMGVEKLAKTLNDEGVPVLCARKRSRGIAVWDKTPLCTLIRGRQVLGEQAIGKYVDNARVLTGEVIQAYEAVITEDQWLAANAKLDRGKRGVGTGRNITKMANIFGDMARCDVCDGRMKIRQKGKSKTYYYLGCSNAGTGKCTAKHYHRLDEVESRLLAFFGKRALGDWHPKPIADPTHAIRQSIARAQTEAVTLEKAYERSLLREGDLAERTQVKLEADHAAKLTEIAQLQRDLASHTSVRPVDEQIATVTRLADVMDGLTGAARIEARGRIAAALPSILDSLRFRPDGSFFSTDARWTINFGNQQPSDKGMIVRWLARRSDSPEPAALHDALQGPYLKSPVSH